MPKALSFLLLALLTLALTVGSACAAPSAEAPPMPAPMPTPVPRMPGGGDSSASQELPISREGGQAWATERMIVRTGEMALVVEDVPSAMERIASFAVGYGGYVVSSEKWGEGDRLAGMIAIRVPASRFDDAMGRLRELAVEVNSESTSSQDVTEEYVDLGAKLQNLEASEEQLLKIMQKAETVDDILSVQRELSKTRGEIEQTKGRMQYLERSSTTSLIEARMEEAKLDARFTAHRATVKQGEGVRFTSEVAGGFAPYSYEWDFGDGNTSTGQNPTHEYKTADSYTVSLKVSDDRGNEDTEIRSEYIHVLAGWSAGRVASRVWNSFVGFNRGIATIFIVLGVYSPVWIVIGVVVYFLRRRKKKSGAG